MNNPPQSWRELLGTLTESPAEKQRVAEALGVNAFTVTRWVNGESEPRLHNLKRLPISLVIERSCWSKRAVSAASSGLIK